jgi:hypothetical protein
MYHTLAHAKTIEFIEQQLPVRQLARELCHKFNVFVMSHDEDKNRKKVHLTRESGTPFCSIRTEYTENQAGNEVVKYVVESPMVQKDKGRGQDRHCRESINLRALLKTLEKDYDDNGQELDLDFMFNERYKLFTRLEDRAERVFRVGWNSSISIDSDAALSVLRHFFEKEPINDKAQAALEAKYKEHLVNVDKRSKVIEFTNRFVTDCLLLVKYDNCPAIVAKVSFKVDENNKIKLSVHDGVKCYAEESALAADYPELVITMKMFNTKNKVSDNNLEDLYPIKSLVSDDEDRIDTDLDVLTIRSGRYDSNCHNIFLTPVTKYE